MSERTQRTTKGPDVEPTRPDRAGRPLPSVHDLTEQQQRGWHCVWCRSPLGTDLGVDLGEQRVTPTTGASFSWFPRECLDAQECAGRRAAR